MSEIAEGDTIWNADILDLMIMFSLFNIGLL